MFFSISVKLLLIFGNSLALSLARSLCLSVSLCLSLAPSLPPSLSRALPSSRTTYKNRKRFFVNIQQFNVLKNNFDGFFPRTCANICRASFFPKQLYLKQLLLILFDHCKFFDGSPVYLHVFIAFACNAKSFASNGHYNFFLFSLQVSVFGRTAKSVFRDITSFVGHTYKRFRKNCSLSCYSRRVWHLTCHLLY